MMAVLLIYYNHHKGTFYHRSYNDICDLLVSGKEVGDTNQYQHELIQILVLENGGLMSVKNYYDYSIKVLKSQKRFSPLKKIIDFFR